MHPRGHARRQDVDPLTPQTASGIVNSVKVINTNVATAASTLAFDAAQTGTTIAGGNNILPTVTVTSKQTSAPTPSQTEAAPTGTLESASGASSPISMKTVIGACVGAFIGAAGFILLALFFYRRYSQSLKRKANSRRAVPRSVFDNSRNSRADQDRRRSKLEPWNELKDNDMEDKWEGMASTSASGDVKEMKTMSPGLYQNSPSGSHYGSAISTNTAYNNHPYATTVPPKVPEARELLGREPHVLGEINSGPPISWAGSESNASFLSTTRLNGGAMSPTMAMAIPTPPPQKSQLHHWESAELVISQGESAEIVDEPQRASLHNPFFNAVEEFPTRNRTKANISASPQSPHSHSSSTDTLQPSNVAASTSEKEKKPRVVSIDPFSDPLPKPKFIHHVHGSSSASSASNDRAIRQLVAAASLDDLSEDEVQRRLRVASMQPSIISNSGDSMYTDAEPDPVDEAMMRSFPVPPSSSSHETVTYSHK